MFKSGGDKAESAAIPHVPIPKVSLSSRWPDVVMFSFTNPYGYGRGFSTSRRKRDLTQARSEITIKFSGSLPPATPVEGKKVEIELTDQNGLVFTAQVNAKSWRKAEALGAEFADWAGMVSGKLGRTDKGFEILDALCAGLREEG